MRNKNRLEYGSHQRLDKEQLTQQCEGEIEADQPDPVGQEGKHIEACIERVIEKRGEKAHGRAHEGHSGTDDRRFKEHRMGLLRIEILHCQFKGARTAHADLQRICQNELDYDYHPDWAIAAQHINAAQTVNRAEHAACASERHERLSVNHIETVKHIGVDSDNNGNKGEDHLLKFVLWHRILLIFEQKRT